LPVGQAEELTAVPSPAESVSSAEPVVEVVTPLPVVLGDVDVAVLAANPWLITGLAWDAMHITGRVMLNAIDDCIACIAGIAARACDRADLAPPFAACDAMLDMLLFAACFINCCANLAAYPDMVAESGA